MAQNAGTLSTLISNRARDPNQTGTTQANVLLLMSYAQQMVNGALQDVVTSFTQNYSPGFPIITVSVGIAANVLAILAVTDASGRDLDPIPFESLVQIDPHWHETTADVSRNYALAGRDQIVFYPRSNQVQLLTVKYVTVPANLTAGANTVVPNEDDDALMDLTELLLLLKARDISSAVPVFQRYQQRIKLLSEEPR